MLPVRGHNHSVPACRILIVDDNPEILRMLRAAFVRLGCEVAIAADSNMAIALSCDKHFDVVLSDVRMPGLSGCELAQWFAGNSPATRVLLMSGHELQCEECPYRPRCTLIRKPFRIDDLAALIRPPVRRRIRSRLTAADERPHQRDDNDGVRGGSPWEGCGCTGR